jgi:hypothetical protein
MGATEAHEIESEGSCKETIHRKETGQVMPGFLNIPYNVTKDND